MTTTELSDLPPGYWCDPATGAWCTLPWPSDPSEKQALAESSLGPLLIRWAENRLSDEELEEFGPGLIDYQTGLPWRFSPGQKRFLILWYAYDLRGRWLYRSGVKRGAKGTGKDPFGAALCNIELVGPSQLIFDGERFVGIQHRMPLVQVASNSEAQSKDMLRVANAMWSRDARAWHELDPGETRTILKGRGRLEVLTASEASSEGDPATFIALNESHHMTATSGGHRVTEVARRNVGKSPATLQARLCEFTNAHSSGSDSTAERSFEAWQDQASNRYQNLKKDILYDSIEADPNLRITDPEQLDLALQQSYSDAEWADLERLADEVRDPRTSVAESIRFYLNGLAAAEDAWVDPGAWDSLAEPQVVADGDRIAMFLDCSKSGDATGLVGCRLSDMYVFEIGVWQKPHGERGKNWLAPRHEVDAKVRETKARYDVVWFGVDPSPARDDSDESLYWMSVIDAWHRDFHTELPVWASPGVMGSSVLFDMRLSKSGGVRRNQVFTETAEYVQRLIDIEGKSGPLRHDGSPALRMHVHQAKGRANQWGTSLGKVTRDSSKLVDLAVCMVGAVMGARDALNSGKLEKLKKKTGRATFV